MHISRGELCQQKGKKTVIRLMLFITFFFGIDSLAFYAPANFYPNTAIKFGLILEAIEIDKKCNELSPEEWTECLNQNNYDEIINKLQKLK